MASPVRNRAGHRILDVHRARAKAAPCRRKICSPRSKQTRPLSVVMAEKVNEIRAWAADRTVPCD